MPFLPNMDLVRAKAPKYIPIFIGRASIKLKIDTK